MYTPNPILLDTTPAGGLTLPVSKERGGLAGYILLGVHGPPASVEVSGDGGATWQALAYPHTLTDGELLRLTRTDTSAALTTLRALAPLDEAAAPAAFTLARDAEGFLTTDAPLQRDADGFLTAPDTSFSRDADGFLTVEGSTP